MTRDAEIKYFNNGNAIVKFSIAQNKRKKQGDNWIDDPQFFDVSFGGKAAEAVHKFLIKGKQVGVQGELHQDRWEQDGQSRSKIYVKAHDIQLLGSKETIGVTKTQAPQTNTNSGQDNQSGYIYRDGQQPEFADDIPF
jgi:single-strand DNA-binding protein